ncbi:hypothetical protein H0H87_007614 [Tephrocybe sp. NHM501043]|nr:hypothetical protein H0H87_007614 [Tephrocybe sp. NHM501043]
MDMALNYFVRFLLMQVMSSARGTPDYRHSRSLLQSRSLRDFRTPPPPPLPDKSSPRVLQVNSSYVVREPCPPISSHSQATPPDFRSKSPTSSTHVSPLIAAPRTTFDAGASPTVPSRSFSSSNAQAHGFRNPPVNPRRHRRLASDFGIARDQIRTSPSPPIADNSSLASTPLTTYAETESDSDTSINHALEYSFPQPPPIDETLQLRRMRSSPMVNLGETNQVKELLRKHWGGAQTSKGLPSSYDHWDGVINTSMDSRYTSDLEDIDMTLPNVDQIAIDSSPRNRFREKALSLSPHTPQSPDLPTLPPKQSEPLSLTHSASSIGARTDLPSAKTPAVSAVRRSTSRPLPELFGPMDRLDLSIEKLKRHDPHHLQPNHAAVLGGYPRKSQPPLPHSPPSLASAGRQKPAPRPHPSAPISTPAKDPGLSSDSQTLPSSPPPRDLGRAFNHRATESQPVHMPKLVQPDKPTPKSFMEITPEQEIQRGSRARVRTLLKRASVSMLSWGKTKSTSK